MAFETLYLPLRQDDPVLAKLDEELPNIWWRASCWTAGPSEWGGHHSIVFESYRLVRETPKGYWIQDDWVVDKPIWRPKSSRDLAKTRRIALDRLLRRKEWHVLHARARLKDAEGQLESVKGLFGSLKGLTKDPERRSYLKVGDSASKMRLKMLACNVLKIVFILNGHDVPIDADRNAPLSSAMHHALQQMGYQGVHNLWEARNAVGELCDPAVKLKEFGWSDGVKLFLTVRIPAGG